MNRHNVLLTARLGLPALALSASVLFGASPRAQDAHAEIYRDPVEFEKVSNAMQNLLIAKFGPRLRVDEKGNPIPPGTMGFSSATSANGGSETALANVLVNDASADATSQDTQSETALVLGAGSKLISSFNDSGSFLGVNHFTGWAYSADGGSSWTDPGTLPGSNDAGDPVLARDETTGRVYLATLFFSGSGINVFRSDDDGVSWLPGVNGAPSSGSMDKEWIAVDNFAGAGNGNVYLIVRDFGSANGIFFFRSTDQGATWGPFGGTPIASGSPSNVQGAYVVVTPNHDVHAFWYDSNPSPDELRTRRSTDQGLTWGPPVTVIPLTSAATNGNLSLVAGFRSNSFPQITVNPVNGDIYVVYNDPVAVSGGDRGNILLCQSTDGGATWAAPVLVNDDGGTNAQYFPGIACRPDGTGLAVCWYDNRNDPGDINIERWGVTASIAGSTLTFGPNFRISPQFVPVFGVDPVVNSVYMGDYDQMAADNTAYYTTWGDQRDDSIAVPARKNANVRFTSFDQDGPGALLGYGGMVVSGGNGNGRIDKNECNDLLVELHNDGTLPATGILATLATTTPGVTIQNAIQPYADLAAGASGQGMAPFQISTSPGFVCESSVQFTLALSFNAGPDVLSFASESSADYVIALGSDSIVPGTTDSGNHGDDVISTINLPFPVSFYATSYNQVVVSSNGVAQFESSSSAYSNVCMPTGTFSDAIALHWDDLRTDGAGEGIFYSTTGVAPNREFHIEWRAHYFSGAGALNFELRLHEGSSAFEVIYASVPLLGVSATIGCQEGSGVKFTQHACNQSGSVGAGTKLSYSLPGCPDGGGQCGGPLAPNITLVLPNHGPNTGLSGVVIKGDRFTGATSVTFGLDSALFVVDSDEQITANLAATSATGWVSVSVTSPDGTGTLFDGFDFFAPPAEVGEACSTPTLTWSGTPTLGEKYTVTTLNLGAATQRLLVAWSDQNGSGPRARRYPIPQCVPLIDPTMVIFLGTTPSHTFILPIDQALVGVHLRTQAQTYGPSAFTQVLDVTIGE